MRLMGFVVMTLLWSVTVRAQPAPLAAEVHTGVEHATPVKKAPSHDAPTSGVSTHPLKGTLGLAVAGGVGALVPLILFALPCVWFAWAGPFGPFLLFFAVIWGGLMAALGGLVAWLLLALFSDQRSGWLIPMAAAGGATAGIALIAAILAAVVVWAFWAVGYFFFMGPLSPLAYPTWFAGSALGFTVWAIGAVGASIVGPVLAAYLYQRLGVGRDDKVHPEDVITPR